MARPHAPLAVKLASNAIINAGIMTEREVADDLGVSHSNVNAWRKDKRYKILRADEVDQIKKSLSGNSYKLAHAIQSGISKKKIESASLSQLAVAQAILIEKGRLLEGLSTQNLSFGNVLQSIEADRSRIASKMEELSHFDSKTIDSQQ